MLKPIRRIVTGHDAQGRSIIASDEPSPHALAIMDSPAFGLTDLWVTYDAPADNAGQADPAARKIVLEPPLRGTIFRVVEFPPDAQVAGRFDSDRAFDAIGARDAHDRASSRHAAMHRTRSVDYAIVLSGEIWAVMDVGETLMRAGDCLIQRGTNHAWSNRSEGPCLVAFILVDAKPLAS
jgi:mannose-6-phosphate isomerase-like protein (cupin superfamily)